MNRREGEILPESEAAAEALAAASPADRAAT